MLWISGNAVASDACAGLSRACRFVSALEAAVAAADAQKDDKRKVIAASKCNYDALQ
jgi:hypothetical protein